MREINLIEPIKIKCNKCNSVCESNLIYWDNEEYLCKCNKCNQTFAFDDDDYISKEN